MRNMRDMYVLVSRGQENHEGGRVMDDVNDVCDLLSQIYNCTCTTMIRALPGPPNVLILPYCPDHTYKTACPKHTKTPIVFCSRRSCCRRLSSFLLPSNRAGSKLMPPSN